MLRHAFEAADVFFSFFFFAVAHGQAKVRKKCETGGREDGKTGRSSQAKP